MKVFISHSSSDKWIARRIAKDLEDRGVDSFLDEKDIETGDSIDDAIQKHLGDCDELLMLLSPAALDSAWVLVEIGGAKALDKRLVPILLHVGTNDLPGPISAAHARDLNDIERYYEEIAKRHEAEAPLDTDVPEPSIEPRTAKSHRVFEVGDRVRLPRHKPSSTYDRDGNDVGWNDEMHKYLGETGMIASVFDGGRVFVDVDDEYWVWLMDWLEPVQEDDRRGS